MGKAGRLVIGGCWFTSWLPRHDIFWSLLKESFLVCLSFLYLCLACFLCNMCFMCSLVWCGVYWVSVFPSFMRLCVSPWVPALLVTSGLLFVISLDCSCRGLLLDLPCFCLEFSAVFSHYLLPCLLFQSVTLNFGAYDLYVIFWFFKMLYWIFGRNKKNKTYMTATGISKGKKRATDNAALHGT